MNAADKRGPKLIVSRGAGRDKRMRKPIAALAASLAVATASTEYTRPSLFRPGRLLDQPALEGEDFP